jgi:hypothetical protein
MNRFVEVFCSIVESSNSLESSCSEDSILAYFLFTSLVTIYLILNNKLDKLAAAG